MAGSRAGATTLPASVLIGFVLALLLGAWPVVAADPIYYKGSITKNDVTTWHVRAGCPGASYGTRTQTGGPEMDSLRIPSDFSCEVMSFSTGRVEWEFPKQDVMGQLPADNTSPAGNWTNGGGA